jgi:NADH-quinone oxidoreductase subunit M
VAIILLLLPLVFSLLLFGIRGKIAKTIAFIGSLITLSFNLFLLAHCKFDGTYNFYENFVWVHDLGINFTIGMDGLSLVMLLLTNILTPIIILSSFNNTERQYPNTFYALILLMQFGLNGVFVALDGILFYMFWEITLIPIWFIAAIWGGENKIKVTLKFFIYTFFGSLFMLLALIYVYLQTPDHSFNIQSLYAAHLSGSGLFFVYGSFFLAFAIKMPVFPFHTWQPDTYTTAPTQGTMLLSGIMLKMGIYGVMRWMMPIAPEAWNETGGWFMVLSIIGIVYASMIAIRQKNMKRIFAYSSIAHVGMIAAGLFSLQADAWQGATIQMMAHGINIIGLFYVADIIEKRLKTQNIMEMGGIAKVAPKFAVLFMIIMLGSVAVPLTNGFPGEFLLLKGIFSYHPIACIIAGTSIILCAVYMLRVYQLSMFGETNETTIHFTDVTPLELTVLSILAVMVILLGFWPNLIFDIGSLSVNSLWFNSVVH